MYGGPIRRVHKRCHFYHVIPGKPSFFEDGSDGVEDSTGLFLERFTHYVEVGIQRSLSREIKRIPREDSSGNPKVPDRVGQARRIHGSVAHFLLLLAGVG